MAPRVKVACHFCNRKVRRTDTIPMGPAGSNVCKDCANSNNTNNHNNHNNHHVKKEFMTIKCAGCTKWISSSSSSSISSSKGDDNSNDNDIIDNAVVVQLQPCGCRLCKDCLIVFLSETRHIGPSDWRCWVCQQPVTTHSHSREVDLRYLLSHPQHDNNAAAVADGTGTNGTHGKKRSFPLHVGHSNSDRTDNDGNSKRTKRTPFEARIRALLEFKEKYGHCKVEEKRSKNKIVKANSPEEDLLGSWCSHVRCGRITITDEQRKRLDDIGFHWEKKTERVIREWNEMFDRLQIYKDRFGDTCVPFEWDEDKKLAEVSTHLFLRFWLTQSSLQPITTHCFVHNHFFLNSHNHDCFSLLYHNNIIPMY